MRLFRIGREGALIACLVVLGCSEDPEDTLSKQSDPTNQPAGSDAASPETGTEGEAQAAAGAESPEAEPAETEKTADPLVPEPRLVGPVATVNGRDIDSNLFYKEFDRQGGAKILGACGAIRSNILNRPSKMNFSVRQW